MSGRRPPHELVVLVAREHTYKPAYALAYWCRTL